MLLGKPASKKTGVSSTGGMTTASDTRGSAMDTIRNEDMIKLALDTIDLVILRSQVDEAMSNKPVDWRDYHRLTRARELLAECNTTLVLQRTDQRTS
jgi:hypothetical protein